VLKQKRFMIILMESKSTNKFVERDVLNHHKETQNYGNVHWDEGKEMYETRSIFEKACACVMQFHCFLSVVCVCVCVCMCVRVVNASKVHKKAIGDD